ncbi:ABC transporter ATP-binding protein [Streptomyces sp. JNUCC 64]
MARWLLDMARPFRWAIGAHLLGSVVWQSLTAAVPLAVGLAFDAVIGAPDGASGTDGLSAAVWLLLALVLARGVAGVAATYVLETFASGLEHAARARLLASLLRKGRGYVDRHRVGDLTARATGDAESLNLMVSPGLDLTLDLALNLLLPIVFIALVDPRLLVSPVAFVALFALAALAQGRRLGPASDRARASFGAMTAQATESLAGIEVVEATGGAGQERARFAERAEEHRAATVRRARVQALSLPPLLLALATAGALAHCVVLLRAGSLTPGELVAVLGLMGNLRAPAQLASFGLGLLHLGAAGARRIMEVLDAPPEPGERGGPHRARVLGEVAMEGVGFGYVPGRPVLRDVSFRVPAGAVVAVVGATGSGKSTLLRLLDRTHVPDRGRVTVDGVSTTDWDTSALRSQVATVEQDVVLFARSIADNLRLGADPGIGRDRLERAARTARAHGFITAAPQGYDTVLGERGVTLSGGQRQRLAIARAVLTEPRILALDDATSAVDGATEHELRRALRAAAKGRTTFVVTPRLSQARAADHVLVLDGGRIVGQGGHARLLRECPAYRRIFAPYLREAEPGAPDGPGAAGTGMPDTAVADPVETAGADPADPLGAAEGRDGRRGRDGRGLGRRTGTEDGSR